MRCVATLGSIKPPGIVLFSDSAVALRITPPAGVTNSALLTYVIKYRKHNTSSDWRLTREESRLNRIVKYLEADTVYEFKVVAKYKGQTSTSDSATVCTIPSKRKPSKGKYIMLYFSFSTPIVLIA